MFAVRDRAEVAFDWESAVLGGPMRPLYNPMWRLLPESSARPGGTYLLKNATDQGIRWRLCDQILVSRELVDKIDGDPEILPMLAKKPLLTRKGSPFVRKFSDHLPVQLCIKM